MEKIIEKILKILKLDEKGRLEKFFTLLQKKLTQDRKKFEHNKETLKLEFASDLSSLEEKLEDAVAEIDDLIPAVLVNASENNYTMNTYMSEYLAKIAKAKEKVEFLEDRIKDLTEKYKKNVAKIDRKLSVIDKRFTQLLSNSMKKKKNLSEIQKLLIKFIFGLLFCYVGALAFNYVYSWLGVALVIIGLYVVIKATITFISKL